MISDKMLEDATLKFELACLLQRFGLLGYFSVLCRLYGLDAA